MVVFCRRSQSSLITSATIESSPPYRPSLSIAIPRAKAMKIKQVTRIAGPAPTLLATLSF